MSDVGLPLPEHASPDDRLYMSAAGLIVSARDVYATFAEHMVIEDFYGQFVEQTRDDGFPTPNFFFDKYRILVEMTGEENSRDQRMLLIPLACAHVGEALRFADEECRDDAWESLLMAQYTIAKLDGIVTAEKKIPDGAAMLKSMAEKQAKEIDTQRRRKAALKGHGANHANQEFAFVWLDEHFVKDSLTNESAAEQLRKIVTGTFSTRLGYVKDWRKSRQGASNPG